MYLTTFLTAVSNVEKNSFVNLNQERMEFDYGHSVCTYGERYLINKCTKRKGRNKVVRPTSLRVQ